MQANILCVRVVSVTAGNAEMSHLPFFIHCHLLVLNVIVVASNMKQVLFLLLFIMPVLLKRNRSKHKKAGTGGAKDSRIWGSYNLRETNPWMIFFWNCLEAWRGFQNFLLLSLMQWLFQPWPWEMQGEIQWMRCGLPLLLAIEEGRASQVLYLLDMNKELNFPFSVGYF